MKHAIVEIRDIKNNSYFPPQFVRAIGGYIRQLSDEINNTQQNPNSYAQIMSKHPEDFEVYQAGEWDDETGTITPMTQVQICVLSSLKA